MSALPGPARGCGPGGGPSAVVGRPAVAVAVVAHHVGRDAHVAQAALEAHRRDLSADEPLDQVVVPGVALRRALEDPLAGLATELVAPAAVLGEVGPDLVAIEH